MGYIRNDRVTPHNTLTWYMYVVHSILILSIQGVTGGRRGGECICVVSAGLHVEVHVHPCGHVMWCLGDIWELFSCELVSVLWLCTSSHLEGSTVLLTPAACQAATVLSTVTCSSYWSSRNIPVMGLQLMVHVLKVHNIYILSSPL